RIAKAYRQKHYSAGGSDQSGVFSTPRQVDWRVANACGYLAFVRPEKVGAAPGALVHRVPAPRVSGVAVHPGAYTSTKIAGRMRHPRSVLTEDPPFRRSGSPCGPEGEEVCENDA